MWDFGIWGFRFDQAGQRASRPFRGRLFALSDARLSVDDVKRHQDVAWAPDGIGNLTQALIVALGKMLEFPVHLEPDQCIRHALKSPLIVGQTEGCLREVQNPQKERDGYLLPSLVRKFYFYFRLERDTAIELDLSAADRGTRDIGGLARPDGIVSRLAEAGMVQHVSGICAE
jgi:hypothetical protein